MILHLMIFSKTSEEYIKFLNKNFLLEEHKFIFWKGANSHKVKIKTSENVKVLETKKDLLLFYIRLNLLKKYDKIIIHGWYYSYFSLFLFFYPKLLKKIYWVIWGGDSEILTDKKKKKFKERFYYLFDVWCKTKVKCYITHIKEEYLLLNSLYSLQGKYIDCFMYPGNMYKEFNLVISETKKEIVIQLGNSAEERNHLEILKKLVEHKDKIKMIYCPLAYGDDGNYVDEFLTKIPSELSDKFYPILKIQPYEEYLKFLSSVDIAIFPFKRQQAFGNILSLLGMGKTVYLYEESLTYKCITRNGIQIKKLNKFDKLETLDKKILEKNKELIKEKFSEEKLIRSWKKIFEDKIDG